MQRKLIFFKIESLRNQLEIMIQQKGGIIDFEVIEMSNKLDIVINEYYSNFDWKQTHFSSPKNDNCRKKICR